MYSTYGTYVLLRTYVHTHTYVHIATLRTAIRSTSIYSTHGIATAPTSMYSAYVHYSDGTKLRTYVLQCMYSLYVLHLGTSLHTLIAPGTLLASSLASTQRTWHTLRRRPS